MSTVAFLLLSKRDRGMKLFWGYTKILRKDFDFKHLFLNNSFTPEDINSIDFKKRLQEVFGTGFIPWIHRMQTKDQTMAIKKAISSYGLKLGLTFCGLDIDQETKLTSKIKLVLPDRSAFQLLVDRFFKKLYFFFPLIDEMSFRVDMETIIIYDFEGHVSSIAFRRKDDFAFLATMLIILRLSYLSLFDKIVSRNEQSINSIDPSSKLQDIKFLFLNPIHIDVISVAEICIKEFDLTRSQSLGVLQAIIFLEIYRDHSPEIGIGTIGSNSQMNHRMIILMAYSLKLNREADNHCEEMAEKKIKNLKRKIWRFLSTSDIFDSIIYGTEF